MRLSGNMICPECGTEVSPSRPMRHVKDDGGHTCGLAVCHNKDCSWGKWACEITDEEAEKMNGNKN